MPDSDDHGSKVVWQQQLLCETNAAYLKLRADHQAWAELDAERAEWEATLADGLSGSKGPTLGPVAASAQGE